MNEIENAGHVKSTAFIETIGIALQRTHVLNFLCICNSDASELQNFIEPNTQMIFIGEEIFLPRF